MKLRNLKPTKAKLPDNERTIGGDASRKLMNNNLKKIVKEVEQYEKSKK
ncbi:hypothetical protein [Emticicia sp. W12TSBA100-4]